MRSYLTTQIFLQYFLCVIVDLNCNSEILKYLSSVALKLNIYMVIIIILIVLAVALWLFLQHPQFGGNIKGPRMERMRNSPNFKDGTFQNEHETPMLSEGANYFEVTRRFFFSKNKKGKPVAPIPSIKTDLHSLDPDKDVLVWFGHSSYFLQLNGKKILVDPVFSGNASPIANMTKSFNGSDIYKPEDLPEIDYLLITHDHYDHLDYRTIIGIKPKVKKVITGLGVGAHFEKWGYNPGLITELDWNEKFEPELGWTIIATPARHFSGRSFSRNKTLWLSFVLITPGTRIYIGGDSGYDDHFARIGDLYGPFDIAILEDGQYNQYWKYIHMMPEEVVQASIDLKAKKLLPVHWSKFQLSLHDWDEPIIRVAKEAERKKVTLLHPVIGEPVSIKDYVITRNWWEGVQVLPG